MKMIGVCAERLYWRISFAVSRPSMSGMLTSSSTTANSRCRISRSACEPERTSTSSCPSSSRMLWKTSSFSGRSSTIRIAAFSSPCCMAGVFLAMQPASQHREQVLAIDGLGEVIPGPGLDALLAVALHRLRGHGDDRQVAAARQLADLLHGGDAVHLR